MFTLTAVQKQVLRLLAEGSTVAAAAKLVGLERVSIAIWCRTSDAFHDAMKVAQAENTLRARDRLHELGEIAIENLHRILTDHNSPEKVRLSAAVAVLDRLMKPAPALADLAATRRDSQAVLETLDGQVQLLNVDALPTREAATGPEPEEVGEVAKPGGRPN